MKKVWKRKSHSSIIKSSSIRHINKRDRASHTRSIKRKQTYFTKFELNPMKKKPINSQKKNIYLQLYVVAPHIQNQGYHKCRMVGERICVRVRNGICIKKWTGKKKCEIRIGKKICERKWFFRFCWEKRFTFLGLTRFVPIFDLRVCVWKCEKEKKDNVNTISSQFLSKSKQFYLRNRNFVGGVLGGGFRNVKYQWFE